MNWLVHRSRMPLQDPAGRAPDPNFITGVLFLAGMTCVAVLVAALRDFFPPIPVGLTTDVLRRISLPVLIITQIGMLTPPLSRRLVRTFLIGRPFFSKARRLPQRYGVRRFRLRVKLWVKLQIILLLVNFCLISPAACDIAARHNWPARNDPISYRSMKVVATRQSWGQNTMYDVELQDPAGGDTQIFRVTPMLHKVLRPGMWVTVTTRFGRLGYNYHTVTGVGSAPAAPGADDGGP